MADFLSQAAKLRVDLLNEDNYFVLETRMKLVLVSKQYWTALCGYEVGKANSTNDARLEYPHHSENAISIITMAITDHGLGSTADTEDPEAL